MTAPAPKLLVALLLVLSFTTGLIDAISVLGLGKVFTANMTGNIVFLGFAAVGTPDFRAELYIVALLAFLLGALLAGKLGIRLSAGPLARWLRIVAGLEAGLLWGAAGLSVLLPPDGATSAPLLAIIALTAVAMGLSNGTVRQLKVPDLTTTVLTLTLTGLAADSRAAGGGNPNWGRRLGSVATIGLGAGIGALLVIKVGLAIPLALTGALILGATLLCTRNA